MLLKKLRTPADQKMTERILALQAQREASKGKIRAYRAAMQTLIRKAAEADDLDRKALSLDYEAQKGLLAVEEEHFADLNRLIGQLQGVQRSQARQDTLSDLLRACDCIDVDALARKEDELAIRRELKKEEDDRLDDAFAIAAVKDEPFAEDEEFARLVRLEQAKKTLAPQPAEQERKTLDKIPV